MGHQHSRMDWNQPGEASRLAGDRGGWRVSMETTAARLRATRRREREYIHILRNSTHVYFTEQYIYMYIYSKVQHILNTEKYAFHRTEYIPHSSI